MVTIVVEDGTGLANSNSYVTLAEADTYFTNQGNAGASWAAPDAFKNEYLVNAAFALDRTYGQWYLSQLRRGDSSQAMLWPREIVWDRNGRRLEYGTIPQVIKDAQCEMALLLQQGVDLFPEGSADQVVGDRVKVGDIEVSNTYSKAVSEADVARFEGFRKVEQILWPILRPRNKRMRFAI